MEQYARQALYAGLIALACSALCVLFAPKVVLFGYLAAFLLWSGIPLGCAAILMLHHVVGGRWGQALRPVVDAAAMTTPLLVLLFVPIALGLSYLYPWSLEAGLHDELIARKRAYLNVPFFLIRAAAFLLVWSGMAWLLDRWSSRKRNDEAMASRSAPRLAVPALIIYVITVSFAALDWIGTLEPHWYSSILGLYILIGQVLSAMAVMVLFAAMPSEEWHGWRGRIQSATAEHGKDLRSGMPPPGDVPSANTFNDLGTLLLTLVVLHAYFAYSQFFIIWNGNLPHEILWYTPRISGLWGWVAILLILIHFALPFALLLSRDIKRHAWTLRRVALLILAARCIEATWFVLPSYDGAVISTLPFALLSMLGVGGVWIGVFAFGWRRRITRLATIPGEEGIS